MSQYIKRFFLIFLVLPVLGYSQGFIWSRLSKGYYTSYTGHGYETFFDVSGLSYDPNFILVAGGMGRQLYISYDGGKHLVACYKGAKGGNTYAVDVINKHIILAGQDAGLYRAKESMCHWKAVHMMDGTIPWMLSVIVHKGPVVYAAASGHLFRSNDSGKTWHGFPEELGFGARINAISIVNPNTLYVGDELQLYKTTDGGYTWQGVKGFNPMTVEALLLDKKQLFVAEGQYGLAVLQTTNGRHHQITRGLPKDIYVTTLAKGDAKHLFLGTLKGDIYESNNTGVSWHRIAHHLGGQYRVRALYAPNPHTVYVGLDVDGLWKGIATR